MKNKQMNYRVDEKILNNFVQVCDDKRQIVSRVLEDIMAEYTKQYKKEMQHMSNGKLQELKVKYKDIMDKINVGRANGDLGKLCNLRREFDETFDQFFDRKELRIQYENAWNEDDDAPNFDVSNRDLEKLLDNRDLLELIEFYENYIGSLEDKLVEMK